MLIKRSNAHKNSLVSAIIKKYDLSGGRSYFYENKGSKIIFMKKMCRKKQKHGKITQKNYF